MSYVLSQKYQGDLTIESGIDTSLYGYGDLNVFRNCIVNGTQDSTSMSSATLVVYGGASIQKTLNAYGSINVQYGKTSLTETAIDTNSVGTTITGLNGLSVSVGSFIMNSASEHIMVNSYYNGNSAVNIIASALDGGVNIISGTRQGAVNIGAGGGGITGTTSSGNIILTCNSGYTDIITNTSADNQNLNISLNNASDSQIKIESAGTNVSKDAILINTSVNSGNIVISNKNGLSNTGGISLLTGSGGLTVYTNTGGNVSISSNANSSNYVVNSNGANQNMSILLNGNSDSGIIMKSSGINTTNDAIKIQTTSSSGNIVIDQTAGSFGGVRINAGANGINITTQNRGGVNIKANGAPSSYVCNTTADGQDLFIGVTGNTDSRVIISSSGSDDDSIIISSGNGTTGGLQLSANSNITADSSKGSVLIGTLTTCPVVIGSGNTNTTIRGNLTVSGTTTTIDSQVDLIKDNIVVLNNTPSGISDGGFCIKRYQSANNTAAGEVILDTPKITGNIQASTNNGSTKCVLALSASSTDNYYAGWWIYITAGTGISQVRRIKSYDGANRIATIYSTSDQSDVNVLNNCIPVQGLDFLTIPDNTSVYSLYSDSYLLNIYDESSDEFAFVCATEQPGAQCFFNGYANLHVKDFVCSALTVNSINGATSDYITNVTLNNTDMTPVEVSDFPNSYGIFQIFVQSFTDTARASGIFMIGKSNNASVPGTSSRFLCVKGSHGDMIDISWPSGGLPLLYYRPNPTGVSGTCTFRLRIVRI